MSKEELNSIVGRAFEEMDIQQMTSIQGSGTETDQSTPAISRVTLSIARKSSAKCISWISFSAGGLNSYKSKC